MMKVVLGAAAILLLVGCGGEPPSTSAAPSSTPSASADPSTSPSTTPSTTPDTEPLAAEPTDAAPSDGTGSRDVGDEDGTTGTEPVDATGTDPGDDGGSSTTEDAPALEMPVDGAGPGDHLSELLDQRHRGPLVTLPLPRAASASARLVTGFPSVLRPTGSSLVETSSLSPDRVRLQVGMVASTSRSLEHVLVAYRRRLIAHGLVEQDAPPAVPGSTAATFRRGPTTVTVTVTVEGSRTTYIVQASLHAGRG